MTAQTDLQLKVYNRLRTNKYVKTATLTKRTAGTYSSVTGSASNTDVHSTAQLIELKPSESQAFPRTMELKKGENLYLFAGNGIKPLAQDFITVDNEERLIEAARDIAVGASALFEIIVNPA